MRERTPGRAWLFSMRRLSRVSPSCLKLRAQGGLGRGWAAPPPPHWPANAPVSACRLTVGGACMTIIKQVSVETGPQALLAGRNEAVGVDWAAARRRRRRPRARWCRGRPRGRLSRWTAACAARRWARTRSGRCPARATWKPRRRPGARNVRPPPGSGCTGWRAGTAKAVLVLSSWTGRAGAPPPNGRRALNSASRSTALLEAACARAPLASRAALKQSRGRTAPAASSCSPCGRSQERGALPAGQRERGTRVCAAAAPVPQWPPTLNPTSLQWRRVLPWPQP